MTVELSDGRIIDVVNQPIKGGGWVAMHEDITERRKAERELEHTRSFLDTIIENVPSPIIVKEIPSLKYLLINRAAEKYLGVDRATILGKTAFEFMPKASAEMIEMEDRKLIESGKSMFVDEHAIVTPGNGTRIVTATRLPVMGADGKSQYLITRHPRPHRAQARRAAHRAYGASRSAHRPAEPGGVHRMHRRHARYRARRRAKASPCSASTSTASRRSTTCSVTRSATALLREVAGRLEQACEGAFIARVGGDEFQVITPTGPQPATAEALAARLLAALDTDIDIDGAPQRVGLTVGVAVFPQDGADAMALVANADAALFRAKSEARGSIRFFEPSMDQQLREKRALQQDLRTAIARGEIELHYQPQAHIGGEVIGFEALVRWHHPTRRGWSRPANFIPLAEESGLIVPTRRMDPAHRLPRGGVVAAPLRIAINLSPVQFRHGDLVAAGASDPAGDRALSPARLELEITEGVLIGDFTARSSILRRLKALGVRIAMDDFGTGYSSLSYLQSFPFDKIKIDQSFIANLAHNQQSAAIVRAVIGLGARPRSAGGGGRRGDARSSSSSSPPSTATRSRAFTIGRPQADRRIFRFGRPRAGAGKPKPQAKIGGLSGGLLVGLVLPHRIELWTSPLPRGCSTTELRQRSRDANIR